MSIINEFRGLSAFINNDIILLENLYEVLAKYFRFDCLGIFFNSPDTKHDNNLYLCAKKKINFEKINNIFFDKVSEYKQVLRTKYHLIHKAPLDNEVENCSELFIPLLWDGVILGGIGVYYSDEVIIDDAELFNFIIEECLRVFKLKYMFSEQVYNSAIDGLTGLYNRHQFDIAIEREFNRAERYKTNFSLLMLDIDYFKSINDTLGHTFGDYVLKEVSQIINKTLRKTDIIYRYGGEEIAIIMSETSSENANLPAEKLRKEIENHSFNNRNVTVSIGIANYNKQSTPKDIIEQADRMLYKAKQTGRNRVCF